MWIQILRNKYLHTKTLAQVTAKSNDSSFWKGLIKVKVAFFNRTKFVLGGGESTRFWEDTWLGETLLDMQYPNLYNIVQRKQNFVSSVMGTVPLNIQFRRSLVGERWTSWLHLVRRLMEVNLTDQTDRVISKLTSSGVFSVKSMYMDLINTGTIPKSLNIWKVKVPPKI